VKWETGVLNIQPDCELNVSNVWYWARPRRRDMMMVQRSRAGRRFSCRIWRTVVREAVTVVSQRLCP
jgi:hypothetical protein